MNRIYMANYGFERQRDMDFSDDGSYFEMWRAGDLYVSKCVSNGYAYISGRPDYDKTCGLYPIYSKVEGYKKLDRLNGIKTELLTDEMMKEFYNDCLQFSKNFDKYLEELVLPTDAEIDAKTAEIQHSYQKLIDNINEEIGNLSQYKGDPMMFFCAMLDWESRQFLRAYKTLNKDKDAVAARAEYAKGNYYGVVFMQHNCTNEDNLYYREMKQVLKNHQKRYFAKRGPNGVGYLCDRDKGGLAIAAETDYETACRQAEKFNAEEE